MKIILLSDLRQRGQRGQVVEVRPGYARNFLLPQGLALEATPGNLKVFAQEKKKIEAKHLAGRQQAAELAARFEGVRIVLKKRATETGALYGSVTASEVVEALAAKGIEIDRRRIDLAGGIRALGDHVVRIELHSDLVAELALTVEAEE